MAAKGRERPVADGTASALTIVASGSPESARKPPFFLPARGTLRLIEPVRLESTAFPGDAWPLFELGKSLQPETGGLLNGRAISNHNRLDRDRHGSCR